MRVIAYGVKILFIIAPYEGIDRVLDDSIIPSNPQTKENRLTVFSMKELLTQIKIG